MKLLHYILLATAALVGQQLQATVYMTPDGQFLYEDNDGNNSTIVVEASSDYPGYYSYNGFWWAPGYFGPGIYYGVNWNGNWDRDREWHGGGDWDGHRDGDWGGRGGGDWGGRGGGGHGGGGGGHGGGGRR
jgi:hypothetical protein